MADTNEEQGLNAVELATELTIAWLGNPNVRATAEEVPGFLKSMHATIGELTKGGEASSQEAGPVYTPAVPVRSSVKPDFITSLIDGSKLKSLKRHLSKHGLTPKEYRERYGLKADYPMVAATYSAHRREVAQRLGLGRKPRAAAETAAAPTTAEASAKPKRAAAAKAPPKSKTAPTKAAPARSGRVRKAEAPNAATGPKPRGRRKAQAPAV